MKKWRNIALSAGALFFFGCGAVAAYELIYCATGRVIDVGDFQSSLMIIYVSIVWLLIGYIAAHIEKGFGQMMSKPAESPKQFLNVVDNLPQAKCAGQVRYGVDAKFSRCPRDGSLKELAPAEVDGD